MRKLLPAIACLFLAAGCAGPGSAPQATPELHVIGVYEGPVHRPREPSGSRISVRVYARNGPVVLALLNYESVLWDIKLADGVRLKEILLSSAHHAQVSGIDEAAVRITRKSIGMAYDDRTMQAVAPKLKEQTGLDITTFQGLYRGFEFSVR